MAQTFQCTVVTPEKKVLEEEVTHVSIPAWDGQIGLLHQRAPLLAKLGYGALEMELASGSKRSYFVGGGFAQMKDDKLSVLTDEAVPAEQVDAEEAQASLKEALALRAVEEADVQRKERDLARARAMVAVAQQRR